MVVHEHLITFIMHVDNHRIVVEEYMAPLILNIEEDQEHTDHHGEDDADHHHQATVHPAAHPQIVRFGGEHLVCPQIVRFGGDHLVCPPTAQLQLACSVFHRSRRENARLRINDYEQGSATVLL